MSKASKIINIFILVFAAAATALGVLLFQKREDNRLAREYVGDAVEKVTQQIDPAARVQSDELKINKTAAEVKEAMIKLESNVDKLVKQRNAIAKALTEGTNTVLEKAYIGEGDEAYTADQDVISAYKGTNAELEKILKRINDRIQYVYVRDQYLADYMKKNGSALELEERVYTASPDNAKLSNSLIAMNTKTADTVTRMKAFQGHIVALTNKISPDSPELNLTIQEYPQLLNQNLTTIQDYVNAHNSLLKEREELLERVRNAESLVDSAETSTSEYKKVAEEAEKKRIEAEKEVARLKRIIDPTGYDEEAMAKLNVNFNLLKELTGKIVYVNSEFGIVTIDLGSESEVVRRTGEHLRVALPDGALLTVATSMDPLTAKYVCKLQAMRVDQKASVAAVLASPSGDIRLPKIGDTVYFSESDIKQMKEIRDERLRRQAEERAALERARADSEFSELLPLEDKVEDVGIESDDDFLNEENDTPIDEESSDLAETAEPDEEVIEEEVIEEK